MNINKLVDETFNNEFNIDQYKTFLSNLFNMSISKEKIETKYGKEHVKYVNKVINLGKFKDRNNISICLFVVELTKESSLYRARTMQRNLMGKLLINNYVDHALVAFYDLTNPDWRFSYVNREYSLTNKGLQGKLSPAKRHSFLVGPNEPNHTCRKQFNTKIIQDCITVDEIKESFNIENVTKEFFNKYNELFNKLDESLQSLVIKDSKIRKEFEDKNIKTEDFAKKIMGQIVFLYFIQKKGWLGVIEVDNYGEPNWGSGSKNFMKKLYEGKYIKYANFFNDVLEPLFYKGLSEDVIDYHYEDFNCYIPFLNGGLFENLNGYNWEDTDILIDNNIFKDILRTFDTFNFTIKEDEPLDKEVAVDPEMLGKVFENLLTTIEQKKTGTFYTPRHIVHFMCQQVLIGYLKTNTSIDEEDLKQFIEHGYLALDSIIRTNDERIKYNGKTYTTIDLPKSIQDNAILLDNLLKNVKIVDPAVGSGAFPVGMMYEIVNARHLLNLLLNNYVDLYKLKKETIENSLYGVDLSFSATDITKLRFWLSLVVDEDVIEPLPNLDNKILAGNSLVNHFQDIIIYDRNRIEEKKSGQLSLFESWNAKNTFNELKDLKKDYFNEKSPNKKILLKQKINDMKWKFIESSIIDYKLPNQEELLNKLNEIKDLNSKPFFIWELEFSEVFQTTNPGFDIVIGNPPYVLEGKEPEIFKTLQKSPYYKGKMDLWYMFGSIGIDLLKNNGLISYIAPNNWTTNTSASKFRDKINSECTLQYFIDFGDFKVFDNADNQTMIYLMQKNANEEKYILKYSLLSNKEFPRNKLNIFLYDTETKEDYIKYDSIYDRNIFKKSKFKFNNRKIDDILTKIDNNKNVVYLNKKEVVQGIVPNPDKINSRNIKKIPLEKINEFHIKSGDMGFVVDNTFKNNLNETEKEFLKPLYEPNQFNKYMFPENPEQQLIYLTTENSDDELINKLPNIKKHLEKFKEIMETRRENVNGSRTYYQLHWPRDEKFFKEGNKILSVRKCSEPTFILTDKPAYVMMSFNIIKSSNFNYKYLTLLLNSDLIKFWLKYKGKLQGSNYQVDNDELCEIPLINDNSINYNQIYDKIYDKNKNNEKINEEIEFINSHFYKLYNLNEEEIQIIKKNI